MLSNRQKNNNNQTEETRIFASNTIYIPNKLV